jgi:hypothetical protein
MPQEMPLKAVQREGDNRAVCMSILLLAEQLKAMAMRPLIFLLNLFRDSLVDQERETMAVELEKHAATLPSDEARNFRNSPLYVRYVVRANREIHDYGERRGVPGHFISPASPAHDGDHVT